MEERGHGHVASLASFVAWPTRLWLDERLLGIGIGEVKGPALSTREGEAAVACRALRLPQELVQGGSAFDRRLPFRSHATA